MKEGSEPALLKSCLYVIGRCCAPYNQTKRRLKSFVEILEQFSGVRSEKDNGLPALRFRSTL